MTKEALKFALLFVVVVLAQVVVFNHLCLWGVALPIVFVFFIVRLPVTMPQVWVLTLSFLLGLSVDVFSDTLGMNALACTLLGGMRPGVFHLYVSRGDELPNPEPSLRSMGIGPYMKYLLTMSALYCLMFFLIESFAFFNVWLTVVRVAASSLLTFVLLAAFSSMMRTRN